MKWYNDIWIHTSTYLMWNQSGQFPPQFPTVGHSRRICTEEDWQPAPAHDERVSIDLEVPRLRCILRHLHWRGWVVSELGRRRRCKILELERTGKRTIQIDRDEIVSVEIYDDINTCTKTDSDNLTCPTNVFIMLQLQSFHKLRKVVDR